MSVQRTFGQWLKQRRKMVDLTQEELSERIGCATVTLRKIEADERQPSKQMAELLAKHFNIPLEERAAFVRFARGETAVSPVPWVTSFSSPNNLPVPPTMLIGRNEDVSAVRKRLMQPEVRLLTLIGPPGIGKTRLAIQVASEVLDDFPDGIFFVALAPISDANLVVKTITDTLSLQEMGPQTPLERLKAFLHDKQTLLVLDNFEQVLGAAPELATLLTTCLSIKLLVTSRAPLRIRQERQWPVPALALPDLNHLTDIETVSQFPSINLFIERAQAVKPDFILNAENARTVAAICMRLDGLPLAIELISARVKLLPPSALLERLYGRVMLQSDGLRDIEPRHRTLNTAIDWSYQLLNADEQTLLRRLGVFVGGWTLEAAEAICADNLKISVLDGLASLLDKNLIKQEIDSIDEARFMMLETIREYALERLVANYELETLRQRHISWFVQFVEKPRINDSKLLGRWWDQLEREHANFRAALTWSETESNSKIGVRLATALGAFWRFRGHMSEARDRLTRLLAHQNTERQLSPDSLTQRAWALEVLGGFCMFQGNPDAAEPVLEESLALFRSLEDKAGIAEILSDFGLLHERRGDYPQAITFYQDSLTLFRTLGNPYSIALNLFFLGVIAHIQSNLQQARAFLEESQKILRTSEDTVLLAAVLSSLAGIYMELGNYHEAHTNLFESLNRLVEVNERWQIVTVLEMHACLAVAEGQHSEYKLVYLLRSARLYGATEKLHDRFGVETPKVAQRLNDKYMLLLRAQLDEATLSSAWAEGRAMTLDQVIDYAFNDTD